MSSLQSNAVLYPELTSPKTSMKSSSSLWSSVRTTGAALLLLASIVFVTLSLVVVLSGVGYLYKLPSFCNITATRSYIDKSHCYIRNSSVSEQQQQQHQPTSPKISSEQRAIAQFSGYIQVLQRGEALDKVLKMTDRSRIEARREYYALERSYLRLNLRSIDWNHEELTNMTERRRLRLSMDCATMEFAFISNETEEKWQLESPASLMMDLSHLDDPQVGLVRCEFGEPGKDFGHHFYTNYSCNRKKEYTCQLDNLRSRTRYRVQVNVEYLKFELGGEVSAISELAYSKPRTDCTV